MYSMSISHFQKCYFNSKMEGVRHFSVKFDTVVFAGYHTDLKIQIERKYIPLWTPWIASWFFRLGFASV